MTGISADLIYREPARTVDIARSPVRLPLDMVIGRGYEHGDPTNNNGGKIDGNHHIGVDINIGKGSEDLGEKIYLPMNGMVVYSEASQDKDLGSIVLVKHKFLIGDTKYDPDYYDFDEYLITRFAHMNEINERLIVGQTYLAGELIGTIGKTGWKFGSEHLHLGMAREKAFPYLIKDARWYPEQEDTGWVNAHFVDPVKILKKYQEITKFEEVPRLEK